MELYALKTMEAEEVAKKIASFTYRHGSPLQILSDQGKIISLMSLMNFMKYSILIKQEQGESHLVTLVTLL